MTEQDPVPETAPGGDTTEAPAEEPAEEPVEAPAEEPVAPAEDLPEEQPAEEPAAEEPAEPEAADVPPKIFSSADLTGGVSGSDTERKIHDAAKPFEGETATERKLRAMGLTGPGH